MPRTPEDRFAELAHAVSDSYTTPAALRRYRDRVAQGLRTWEQTVIRQSFPASGTVAVIGCGAGRELFAIRGRGYAAWGFDIAMPLLRLVRLGTPSAAAAAEAATATATRPGVARVADGHLPLGDSVDAVTLWSQVLGNVPGDSARRHLLAEVHRILRPGGTVSFSVHDRERTLPLIAPGTASHRDDPEPGDLLLREDDEETTRYWHYFQRGEVEALCHGAGLTQVRLCHTSDLGEDWGNVWVVVAQR